MRSDVIRLIFTTGTGLLTAIPIPDEETFRFCRSASGLYLMQIFQGVRISPMHPCGSRPNPDIEHRRIDGRLSRHGHALDDGRGDANFDRKSRGRCPIAGYGTSSTGGNPPIDWVGCSLHNPILPSLSFLVGVALPFSLARRKAEGQPQWHCTVHAFWRALILIIIDEISNCSE